QTAVRLGDLGELLAGEGVDGEDQAGDLLGEPAEVDGDHLVVPGALAGEIVAGVLDRAVQDLQLAEVAAVVVVALRTVGDDRGVQVDVLAAVRRLPAETHPDLGEQRAAALHQGDRLVLLEADPALVQVDLARAGGRGGRGRGSGGRGRGLRGGHRRRGRCRRRLDGGGRRGDGLGGGGGLLDGDAEVGGDAGQPVGVALADGAGLPGAVAQVDLDDHQGGLVAQARRGEGGQDRLVVGAPEGGRRVDALEGLARGVGAGRDDDLLDAGREGGGVDGDRVGGGAAARAVGHAGARGRVGGDEVVVGAHLAVGGEQQARYVEPYRCGDVHRHAGGGEGDVRAGGHSCHARSTSGTVLPFPYPWPEWSSRFPAGVSGGCGGGCGRCVRCRACSSRSSGP